MLTPFLDGFSVPKLLLAIESINRHLTCYLSSEVTKPWFDAEDGPTRQLRINRTWVPTEIQTNMGENGQTAYLIANRNITNKWGYAKAYRFQPGLHAVHNVSTPISTRYTTKRALLTWPGLMYDCIQPVQGSRRLLNSARWGEWDLMVAKAKDTEPSSSSAWNQHLPVNPPVDFSKVSVFRFSQGCFTVLNRSSWSSTLIPQRALTRRTWSFTPILEW